jgi:protein arginine kinase activator
MLGIVCQVCGKRPASTHLTELAADSGERRELHICATCIQNLDLELGTDPPAIVDILAKKTAMTVSEDEESEAAASEATPTGVAITCGVCGLTLSEFSTSNRFGCAACYDSFHDQVEPLLVRYHGTAVHHGRLPAGGAPSTVTDRLTRRTHLDSALRQAIASEDYERAARLRDELHALDGETP